MATSPSLTIRQQLVAWFAVACLVGAVGTVVVEQERGYDASVAAVEQTMEVEQAIDNLLFTLTDAETGQRGYLLTSRDAFLESYTQSSRELPARLARLAELLGGDPQ